MDSQGWKVGDVLRNTFEVTGKLGEGGMGTVYKIRGCGETTDYAVKCPKPKIFSRVDGKENFIREAQTWVNLGMHRHIVCCFRVFRLDSILCIFAQYVDGGSLADWICTRRLYEGGHDQALERILDVAIQFAWGLHFAHERGMIHQDVKPANVMMTREGITKVTDFGLAKAREMAGEADTQKAEQSILVSCGGLTPAYCSPEQSAHQQLSRKTDIWSWGASVLEMFVGEVTWRSGVFAREALASHEPQDSAIPMMPAEMVTLLDRCFQEQPENRPATMLEVANELQAIYARLVGRSYPRQGPGHAKTLPADVRGHSLQDLGQLEEALAAYEQAIQLDPTDAQAYREKGHTLERLGRLEEALVVLEQAIQLEPTDSEIYRYKGDVLHKLGQLEEALAVLERAILLEPTSAKVYFYKGDVLSDLGRLEEALAAYEQAIQLDLTSTSACSIKACALAHKGSVLAKLERLEEVRAVLEQFIQFDPTSANAYVSKGLALGILGRLEEALAAYEQAIQLDPSLAEAYNCKGGDLRRLGRVAEAEQAYQRAQELRGRG